ncbi:hypothetical protein [Nocardioides maradonensis]
MSEKQGWWRPAALVVGLLLLSAGAGALGGWGWWSWWSPAPRGVIGQRTDTGQIGWFAEPFDPGQAHVASSTFEYVVIGFVIALVVGIIGGVLGRNRALLTLAVAVVGSIVGAVVMWAVGMAFSPPNPEKWAVKENVGHHYVGSLTIGSPRVDLHLYQWLGGEHIHFLVPVPCLVWPVGMLLGFLVVMLAITSESTTSEPASAEPAPLG